MKRRALLSGAAMTAVAGCLFGESGEEPEVSLMGDPDTAVSITEVVPPAGFSAGDYDLEVPRRSPADYYIAFHEGKQTDHAPLYTGETTVTLELHDHELEDGVGVSAVAGGESTTDGHRGGEVLEHFKIKYE
jgi:hypothetical protein